MSKRRDPREIAYDVERAFRPLTEIFILNSGMNFITTNSWPSFKPEDARKLVGALNKVAVPFFAERQNQLLQELDERRDGT